VSEIQSVGTYLPPWRLQDRRVPGPDEDTLTMAVAAGRAADPSASAHRVVMVSRDFPLLEGGNGAVLLAGLSLPADVQVTEVLGGAPAVLDQLVAGGAGTLVIAADDCEHAAGAAAALLGDGGAAITPVARRNGSLPTLARGQDGGRHTYADPRLQREVGVKSTLARLNLPDSPVVAVVAGAKAKELGLGFDIVAAQEDWSTSAAAVIRLIAAAIESRSDGLILAIEQSMVTVAQLTNTVTAPEVSRDETLVGELPKTRTAEGTGIPISLAAYARAFEPKLRWEAAIFDERPGIDSAPVFPPRVRVDSAGALATEYRLEPLPRTGTIYTQTTIRIPVPDLPSPYSLAVVQLDDSPVRVLLKVTGAVAGGSSIGQSGSVVLRRIATRAGIPDYGYAFWPGRESRGVSP
jgi:uncharacterized OB-fold protein